MVRSAHMAFNTKPSKSDSDVTTIHLKIPRPYNKVFQDQAKSEDRTVHNYLVRVLKAHAETLIAAGK